MFFFDRRITGTEAIRLSREDNAIIELPKIDNKFPLSYTCQKCQLLKMCCCNFQGSVHTTLKEFFENGGFTPKTRQMFFVHTFARGILETQQCLDLCVSKTLSGKSHDYSDAIVFVTLRFQDVFCPHENEKPPFSNSSGLKSVFEKLRFRDGFGGVDGTPNRRNKAAFSRSCGVECSRS